MHRNYKTRSRWSWSVGFKNQVLSSPNLGYKQPPCPLESQHVHNLNLILILIKVLKPKFQNLSRTLKTHILNLTNQIHDHKVSQVHKCQEHQEHYKNLARFLAITTTHHFLTKIIPTITHTY